MTEFVDLNEAVARIPDGATVATNGFTLMVGPRRSSPAGQSNREIGFEHFLTRGSCAASSARTGG